MRKVYEAPAVETITFFQEDVLGPSAHPDMFQNPGAVLGNGTTGQGTQGSDTISGGIELW